MPCIVCFFCKHWRTIQENHRLMFSKTRGTGISRLLQTFRPSCRHEKRPRHGYAGCSSRSVERCSIMVRKNDALRRLPEIPVQCWQWWTLTRHSSARYTIVRSWYEGQTSVGIRPCFLGRSRTHFTSSPSKGQQRWSRMVYRAKV